MARLNISSEKLAILREMIAAWPAMKQRAAMLLPIIGAGSVTVKQSKDGITIYAPPATAATTPKNADGSVWLKIKSSSSVGTDQWNYKVRVMKSGDASSYTGLVETQETTEFDARNANETVALGGLADIASLTAIATGSIVRGWPEIRNDARIYVFDRSNDVTCP